MPGRQHHQQFLLQQFDEGQLRRPRHRHAQQGHLDVAPHHRLDQVGGRILAQVEFDLRDILAKRLDDPRHHRVQHRGGGEADGQLTDLPARRLPRPRRGAIDRGQDGVRLASSSVCPATVSSTPRALRMNSVTPSSVSSARICWLSGGCCMPSRRAARVMCRSSATATK